VLPGVHVGGVDLSGLDRHQATLALAAGFSEAREGRVVLRTVAGDFQVPYRGFGREADIEAMLDDALAAGRSGNGVERALETVRIALHGQDVAPRVRLDEAALADRVETALSRLARPPVDATVAIGPVGFEVSIARPGRAFDLAAVQAAAEELASDPDSGDEAVVDVPTVEIRPTIGDAAVMGAVSQAERVVGDVEVADGADKRWTIPAATVRNWLRFEPTPDGAVDATVDPAPIPTALGAVAKDVDVAPVEATFLIGRDGTTVGFSASRDGRRLDTAATAAAISAAMRLRAAGAAPAPVPAVVVAVRPKLTTEEAQKTAPLMVRLSSWKTWFPIGERNYWGANIWLPAKFINGTVLRPGQRFEWWRAVGPITTARGFGPGAYIAVDHSEPTGALAGGMCSSSTTLFNAALRAGLQMGARANHKYYINRYPLGLDATVSMSGGRVGQTMSFTNDMAHPIIIRGSRIGGTSGKGWVVYEIWGVPDGRTVSLSKPAVWNVRKATTDEFKVTTLPKGVRKQTEYPANGMDVSVTRVVRRGGQVIHKDTYFTRYVRWDGRIEVGA
jgi:vancomycin resistance protein YoaR